MKRKPGEAQADYLKTISEHPGITTGGLREVYKIRGNSIRQCIATMIKVGMIYAYPVENGKKRLYAEPQANPPKPQKAVAVRKRDDDAIEVLRMAGKTGLLTSEFSEKMGVNSPAGQDRLCKLQKAGKVASFHVGEGKSHQKKRWWLKGCEPVILPAAKKKEAPKPVGLDRSAPAIIPPGVRVQVLPGFVENAKFKADPSIAGRGVISQDWFLSRQ